MIQKILKTSLIFSLLTITSQAKNNATVKQLFQVQTVKVVKQDSFISKQNYGYVKAAESRTYEVSPRYFGYVTKLFAKERYKKVKKGEPLATVYAEKVAMLKYKFVESFRYRQKEVIFDARERLELLEVDKASLDKIVKTKKYSNFTTLFSPADGYVFDKTVTHGSSFTDQEKIFTIVNLDMVWVEVKIPQEQIASLSDIESFELNFKANNQTYHTKHFKLYPNFSTKEATATLRLMLKNPGHKLFPGMYASVKSKQKKESYLTLPKSAVIQKNGDYYCFITTDFKGHYEPIKVSVKPLDNKNHIITHGLNEGEKVVNNAMFMMDADAQINALY
jgi:membrane fusion protein, copper/silver efflux system